MENKEEHGFVFVLILIIIYMFFSHQSAINNCKDIVNSYRYSVDTLNSEVYDANSEAWNNYEEMGNALADLRESSPPYFEKECGK